MKQTDEIIAEVRATRDAYASWFNFDLAEIYKYLKAKEEARNCNIAPLRPLNRSPTLSLRVE